MAHSTRVSICLWVFALTSSAGYASARPAASAPGALSTNPRAEVVLDNQSLGERMAQRDARERRAKYQGDSPFATGDGSDPMADEVGDRSSREQRDRFRPVALTLNPITLAFARFGANIEYLPAPHHGIMLNPYYSSYSLDLGSSETTYELFGAELGYHFYTGTRGANGFFAGPSLVFMHSARTTTCTQPGCATDDLAMSTYGVAIDIGGQAVLDNGFTIGGGGGIMYLQSTDDGEGGTTIKFSGAVPRILFTIGYSI